MKPLRFWFGLVVGGILTTISSTLIGRLRSPEDKPIEYRRVCHSTGPDILIHAPLTLRDVGISDPANCDLENGKGFWGYELQWRCKQQTCEVQKQGAPP